MREFICPVCGEPLDLTESKKSLRCEQGHNFDIAKQGYINLLLSHKKKSKAPGDNAEMIEARRQFLAAGYYDGFANYLVSRISGLIQHNQLLDDHGSKKSTQAFHYLDVGCGEGFYTQKLAHELFSLQHGALEQSTLKLSTLEQAELNHAQASETAPPESEPGSLENLLCSGLDISLPGIKAAAKRDKQIQWCVGSAMDLPFEDNSCALVTVLFCRIDLAHILQKIRPGGYLVIASTGPAHLQEMRTLLYDQVKTSEAYSLSSEVSDELKSTISVVSRTQYRTHFELDCPNLAKNLLMMTPHFWRTKADKQQSFYDALPLDLSVEMDVLIIRKD